jgi:hypothetical protein
MHRPFSLAVRSLDPAAESASRPNPQAFSARCAPRVAWRGLRGGSGALLGFGLLAVVFGGGCDNISLSNGADFSGAANAAGPAPSQHVDSGAEAGPAASAPVDGAPGVVAPTPSEDAGVASVTTGNPLCFYSYAADSGAHNCQPDTSSQCGDDAGAYHPPSDDAGDGGEPASACHVWADPEGQKCLAAGPGLDGAQCQSGTDCAAGFECVGSPGQCRHYCCGGNASCDSASATFCDVQSMASGTSSGTKSSLNVPVCEPVRPCTLLVGAGAGSCPSGETCAVVKDDGTTSCVAIGNVGIGGDCGVYHCAAQLTCLGAIGSRKCFQLCEVDSPTVCPTGTTCTSSAQLFANANVGICQ